MVTRLVCLVTVPSAITACTLGHGTTATAACASMLCSILTELLSTAIALSTAMTAHSAMHLDLPTSKNTCTLISIGNSCRFALPALGVIPTSCDGVEQRPYHLRSRRSFVACSNKLARPETSTLMVSKSESTGMVIKSQTFGVSTTARLLQYKAVITPVLHRSTQSVSPPPTAYIRRRLPPKKGFESLALAALGSRLS